MFTNSISNDIKYQFRYGNMVVKLIFINVGVFIFFGLLSLLGFVLQDKSLYNILLTKAQMPASFSALLYQPWSAFTYMFLHTGLLHIVFNMLWLYWFGEIFELYLGDNKILPLYLIGGVSGAIVYALSYNLLPVFKPQLNISLMMGASASVFAIVFGAATLAPNYEVRLLFLGNVRIKYIALVSLLLDVINIPYGNAGGYLAHVGGAVSGYFFIKTLQGGIDVASIFKRKTKMKVSRTENFSKSSSAKRNDSEQQRVDEILDKIARSGYDSLSKVEKDFLFKFSNKK